MTHRQDNVKAIKDIETKQNIVSDNAANDELKAVPGGKSYGGIAVFKKAQWIEDPNFDGQSVSSFFCEFETGIQIKSAVLYITAAGFFQSYINGVATDKEYFKPVLTDFAPRNNMRLAHEFNGGRKKLTYYTYDVLKLLKGGCNNIEVLLGTGYYYNTEKRDIGSEFSYGTPKLVFELHLSYPAHTEVVSSGPNINVCVTNRKSMLFGGDYIDYTAPFGPPVQARISANYTGELICPEAPADKIRQEYSCKAPQTVGNAIVYDFGTNHTGGLVLRMQGERGAEVKVRYAEVKNQDGGLNFLTSAWQVGGPEIQEDGFVLSGNIDEFEPLFCFKCYRFVEISCDTPIKIISIKSLFICTPLVRDGSYLFGGGELDRFSELFAHTQLCNVHVGVPIDCPHREKIPYTADGWLTMESALYLFDAEMFYSKWLDDILESQGSSGFVPYTAPYCGGGGGYAWGNAIVEVPLQLFLHTGNKQYIARAIPGVLRWLKYYRINSGADGAVDGTSETWLLGDWLSPEYNTFDITFMSTLCKFRALGIAEQMCRICEMDTHAQQLSTEKAVLRNQINDRFYNRDTGNYMSGRQGENILPVAYGIPEEAELKRVLKNIRKLYTHELGCCPDTGIVATPLLLEVLTHNGMEDLAFDIMTQQKYPSFFYMIKGETTLREHWSKAFPPYNCGNGVIISGGEDISRCHPMFGSVAAWMYKNIAGLNLSRLWKNELIFAPKFYTKILKASAKKMLSSGLAAISYENHGSLEIHISIPNGFTGICILRDVAEDVEITGNGVVDKSMDGGEVKIFLTAGKWALRAKLAAQPPREDSAAM